ncbi:MAG: isoprenylcysteine carboxylmethyltransferase family protein [Anaerolineaceae bacterium]
MPTGFLWILLYFLPYGLVHSWMASLSFKAFLENRWPNFYRGYYRLFYNLFSVVSFLPLLAFMAVLPDVDLYRIPAPWSYLMRTLQLAALVLAFFSMTQTDIWSFLGLRQVINQDNGGGSSRFVSGSFYRWVRHPIYFFALLLLWLTPFMSWNGMGFNIGTTMYLIVGMLFEERKLLREFGDEYARYQKQVPALIPFLKFRR